MDSEDISAPGVCGCGTEIPSGVRYCSQSCRNTDRMFHRQEAAPEPTLEHRVTSCTQGPHDVFFLKARIATLSDIIEALSAAQEPKSWFLKGLRAKRGKLINALHELEQN